MNCPVCGCAKLLLMRPTPIPFEDDSEIDLRFTRILVCSACGHVMLFCKEFAEAYQTLQQQLAAKTAELKKKKDQLAFLAAQPFDKKAFKDKIAKGEKEIAVLRNMAITGKEVDDRCARLQEAKAALAKGVDPAVQDEMAALRTEITDREHDLADLTKRICDMEDHGDEQKPAPSPSQQLF